jgi:creatinine amidohydrolase
MYLLPTTTAAEEQSRNADVAVLPVGSYEQHGAHLPLATDSIVAQVIAERLADAYDLLPLPPVTISCSHEHEGLLAGTVSITAHTLYGVIADITNSLERSGIDKLAVVSGHGGNYVLSNVVQESNVTKRRMLLYPNKEAWVKALSSAGCESTPHDDMHGGEVETSILLFAAPDLVREGWADADHQASYRPDFLTTGMIAYTRTGIIGRPSLASAEKGDRILHGLVQEFAPRVKLLRQ